MVTRPLALLSLDFVACSYSEMFRYSNDTAKIKATQAFMNQHQFYDRESAIKVPNDRKILDAQVTQT